MSRIVLITGQMRSGTSLVAAMVHHLGFQIAPLIPAPAPPSWRSDWEDPHLTTKLMLRNKCAWASYFEHRRELSSATGFGGRIAVKSPYLALHHAEIERAAKLPIWIRVDRDSAAVARSFEAHPQLSQADQHEIREALDGFTPELVLRYEEIIDDPTGVAVEIGICLGVEDEDAVCRAANLVGDPTEYTCPH